MTEQRTPIAIDACETCLDVKCKSRQTKGYCLSLDTGHSVTMVTFTIGYLKMYDQYLENNQTA